MSAQMLPIGTRYCHCRSCGAFFGGEKTFERHRAGDMDNRRCLAPHEMAESGLEQDARGYWRREYAAVAS